jgi:hypothetical protein
MVQHTPTVAEALIHAVVARSPALRIEERTMVEAVSDDGQRLVALNEVYLGQPRPRRASSPGSCARRGPRRRPA